MTQRRWQNRIAAYLEDKGYCRDGESGSKHYIRYRHSSGIGKYYYLGKAGACLVNSKPTITGAVSVTDIIHRQVILWENNTEQ